MITVTLVTNDGAGLPCLIPVVDGTTLEKFLALSFEGNPAEFTIRIRANGMSVEAHQDYVLQHDDRVSLAPRKVDGETTRGPGTNVDQIEALKEKIGECGVVEAYSIIDGHHPDVVALAYKLMRVNVTKKKLPKAVTNLLDKLDPEDAKLVRGKLVSAKN